MREIYSRSLSDREAIDEELKSEGYEADVRKGLKESKMIEKKEPMKKVPIEEIDAIIENYENDLIGDEPLRDLLKSHPEIHTQVFERWFKINRNNAIQGIGYFKHLDANLQPVIFNAIKNDLEPGRVLNSLLVVFDKITNLDLCNWIVEKLVKNNEWETIAKYKFKLPYISQKISNRTIFNKLCFDHFGRKDWRLIVNYLELFSWIDKEEALKEVWEYQKIWRGDLGIIIKNKQKLGLSTERVVSMFIERKELDALAANSDLIEQKFHQRIVDECIEKGHSDLVMRYANNFKQLDKARILKKIVEDRGNIENSMDIDIDFSEYIAQHFSSLQEWCQYFPPQFIEELVQKYPETVGSNIQFFGEKIDHEALAKILLEKKDFSVLLHKRKEFGFTDNEIAMRIAMTGEYECVAQSLRYFEKKELSRELYILLRECARKKGISAELLYKNILMFSNLDREDACDCVKNSVNPLLVHLIIENYTKFVGLELNKDFAFEVLKNNPGPGGKIILEHIDKFSGLDASVGIFFVYHRAEERAILNKHPELLPNETTDNYIKTMWNFYEDPKVPLKIRKSQETGNFVSSAMIEESKNRPSQEALFARLSHLISPEEYTYLEKNNPLILEKTDGRLQYDEIIKELAGKISTEQDGAIADQLRAGAEYFGSETLLTYMNRPDLSRHDALYFMPDIIQTQKISGVTPVEFARNILSQVAKDGASYESGTAHHHFARIMNALKETNPNSILEQAKKYTGIKTLQTLLVELGSDGPYSSWKTLKKFYEISELVKRSELLEELNRGDIPMRLKTYIEKLAFHPNISADAVICFWKNTAEFLDIDDQHTPNEVNHVKKPSNLLSLPYLGLEGEDLRDALVNGELDDLQTLPPMERYYYFGVPKKEQINNDNVELLYHVLRKAIGERKNNIKGVATNVPKLFNAVQMWCKENNIKWNDLWSLETGKALLSRVKLDALSKLKDLLYDEQIGIRGENETFQTYRARIGLKSDPEMVVAGNDTASCMPFGSGKNNVYMFNPTYAQMVVERLNEDGKFRTGAQSVLNLDHKTATSTPELIEAYASQGKSITELVKPGDLENLPTLALDNIEVAKNEEGSRVQNIKDVYQAFIIEYLTLNAEKLKIDRTRAVVGTGYTPSELGFSSEKNTYIPVAPAGYSDNIHEKCLVVETGLSQTDSKTTSSTLTPLTTRDALSVGVLEGKAFADNKTLLEGFHKMQYNIMGMEIANRHFNRPNLSFMYRDKNNLPRGYILAYEAARDSEQFVFIDDLSSDRESKLTGGRLIKQFFEAYAKNYGTEQRPFLPIFTNARDSTSYPILLRNAKRMAEEIGAMARIVELGQFATGKDVIHNVVVLVGKDETELEQQEQKMKRIFSESSR